MQHHLTVLLSKQPSHLTLHVGTNNSLDGTKNAEDMFDEILELRRYAGSLVPGVCVVVLCAIIRKDDSKANLKVIQCYAHLGLT